MNHGKQPPCKACGERCPSQLEFAEDEPGGYYELCSGCDANRWSEGEIGCGVEQLPIPFYADGP